MLCKFKDTQLCGNMSYCCECNTEDKIYNYEFIPSRDLQNISAFKCKPALLKDKTYTVTNGVVITEFGKVKVGSKNELLKNISEYIKIL